MKSLIEFYAMPFLWIIIAFPLVYIALYYIGYLQYLKLVIGCLFIVFIPIAIVASGLNSIHDTLRRIEENSNASNR